MQQDVVSARVLAPLARELSQEQARWRATKPCSAAPMGREAETMLVRNPTSHMPEPVQISHRRARVLAEMLGASHQTHGESRLIRGVVTTTKARLLVLEARAKAAVDSSMCSATSLVMSELLQSCGQ